MATASKLVAYPHISATPGVRGGRPCVDGTRITVMDIVALERMGLPAEEMRNYYSSRPLTLAEVYAALTYYHDHKAEVDACFEEDRQWDLGHEERKAEYLRQKAGK
jgi:uncharacterized protein (DUF433 family)